MEFLKKHKLDGHPGLLVNLALAQFSRGQKEEGHQQLSRALSLCPDHPVLQQMHNLLNQGSEPDDPDKIGRGSGQINDAE